MIEPDLIQNRINNFWGYGILTAPVWLVGMEERFDVKKFGIEMLEEQFQYAKNNMRDGMLDASRSKISEWQHLANMEPFLSGGKLQHTWKFPIMLYLFFKNKEFSKEPPTEKEILDFQHFVLADCDKVKEEDRVATLELSPLPCPNTNDPKVWQKLYDKFMSREKYKKQYFPLRTKKLKSLIQEHSSTLKLVIFYSMSYLEMWEEAIGKNKVMEKTIHEWKDMKGKKRRMYFTKTEKTSFCIIPQNWHNNIEPINLYDFAEKIKEKVNFLL